MMQVRLALLSVAFVLCAELDGAQGPATAPAPRDSDAVRVFRWRAVGHAQVLKDYAESAGLDDPTRASLVKLCDDHLRAVDQAIEEIRRNPPPPGQVLARAEQLARPFDEQALVQWAQANPQAMPKVQKSTNDGIHGAMMGDRQQLVRAAMNAGLPAAREADAKRIVEEGYQRLVKMNDAAQKIQEQIGKMPDGDAKELAMMAVMADGQTGMMDVARSIRQGLGKLLTPEQRQQFNEELLKIQPPG
jgi:hypothetical protein